MRFPIQTFWLLAALLVPLTQAQEAPTEEAKRACLAWISQIDARLYSDSYDQASKILQRQVPRARWISQTESGRAAYGKVERREITGSRPGQLPVSGGQLDFLSFTLAVTFEDGQQAIESASVTLEDGAWKAIGYYIRPAPGR